MRYQQKASHEESSKQIRKSPTFHEFRFGSLLIELSLYGNKKMIIDIYEWDFKQQL